MDFSYSLLKHTLDVALEFRVYVGLTFDASAHLA